MNNKRNYMNNIINKKFSIMYLIKKKTEIYGILKSFLKRIYYFSIIFFIKMSTETNQIEEKIIKNETEEKTEIKKEKKSKKRNRKESMN